jgi:hypothetical protein
LKKSEMKKIVKVLNEFLWYVKYFSYISRYKI